MLNLISLFGVWYWRTGPQSNVKMGFVYPPGTQLYSPVSHKSSVYIQLQFKCAKSPLCPAVEREVSLWKQIIPPQADKPWWFDLQDVLSSILFSRLVVSDSLRPHELQHPRPPCPSSTPGVHSDSRPSSRWCHPAIASSVVLFSSCPQSLPASESFPMSQLFAWGGQGSGVSASASFLPKKSQGWSPSEWPG